MKGMIGIVNTVLIGIAKTVLMMHVYHSRERTIFHK